MHYQIRFKPSAAKELEKIDRPDQVRIAHRIDELSLHPRPAGAEKLKGIEGLYRLRVGDYRVIYMIEQDHLLVLVVKIGHRREIYRGF